MKTTAALALAVLGMTLPGGASALEPHRTQDNANALSGEIVRLDVEARADFDWLDQDGRSDNATTGLGGKYLVMRLDGTIMPGLTYSWRQRFNKNMADFNATDWVYLNYNAGNWGFQFGKEVVAIGGYEYDRAPIDLYGCSVFWNNIPCYAFGAAASYGIGANDRLGVQVCRSPFALPGNRNMYGYNLMWTGQHGIYSAIWSANMMEYAKGHYINYLALGNQFDLGRVRLQLDYINRAAHQTFMFRDCSVMAELSYRPNDRWRIYGKYTYDVNHSGTGADMTVLDGTELNMAGAGLEYYPLAKDRTRLRVHAGCFHSWGKNANSADAMQHNTTYATVGLTWDMQILALKRK